MAPVGEILATPGADEIQAAASVTFCSDPSAKRANAVAWNVHVRARPELGEVCEIETVSRGRGGRMRGGGRRRLFKPRL